MKLTLFELKKEAAQVEQVRKKYFEAGATFGIASLIGTEESLRILLPKATIKEARKSLAGLSKSFMIIAARAEQRHHRLQGQIRLLKEFKQKGKRKIRK